MDCHFKDAKESELSVDGWWSIRQKKQIHHIRDTPMKKYENGQKQHRDHK